MSTAHHHENSVHAGQAVNPSFSGRPTLVVGLFHHREKAEAALAELQAAGFATADIGVAAMTGTGQWPEYHSVPEAEAANIGSGAATGAAVGAGLGGLWALGIAAGMMPAVGPVIAGGILGSLLVSAAAGAAAGGIVGGLVGLGVSEEDANFYNDELKRGRIVVSVRTATRFDEARRIMADHGAYDVERRTDEYVAKV